MCQSVLSDSAKRRVGEIPKLFCFVGYRSVDRLSFIHLVYRSEAFPMNERIINHQKSVTEIIIIGIRITVYAEM